MNVFQEEEKEIRNALRTYLKSCVSKVNWEIEGKTILDFMHRVDWEHDFILTFNYDLLLEAVAERLPLTVGEQIIHLHGAIGERTLAWPTYTKFAYRTTKMPLAPRWKKAFSILRNQAKIDRLVFFVTQCPNQTWKQSHFSTTWIGITVTVCECRRSMKESASPR